MAKHSASRVERICSDVAYAGYLYGGVVIVVILGAQLMPFDTAGWGLAVGMPLLLGIVPVGATAIVLSVVRVLQILIPSTEPGETARGRPGIAAAWPFCTLAVLTAGAVILYGTYVFLPQDRRESFWPVVVVWSSIWAFLSVVLPPVWFFRWRRQTKTG